MAVDNTAMNIQSISAGVEAGGTAAGMVNAVLADYGFDRKMNAANQEVTNSQATKDAQAAVTQIWQSARMNVSAVMVNIAANGGSVTTAVGIIADAKNKESLIRSKVNTNLALGNIADQNLKATTAQAHYDAITSSIQSLSKATYQAARIGLFSPSSGKGPIKSPGE